MYSLLDKSSFTYYTVPYSLTISLFAFGLLLLLFGLHQYFLFKSQTSLFSLSREQYITLLYVFLGLFLLLGIFSFMFGFLEILLHPNFWDTMFYPVYSLGLKFFTGLTSSVLILFPLILIPFLTHRILEKRTYNIKKGFFIKFNAFIFIFLVGFIFLIFGLVTSYHPHDQPIGFYDPAYQLPEGSHYNTLLDNETAINQELLTSLEFALWSITRTWQGGFSMYVQPDGSSYYGHKGLSSPYHPFEFSLQMSTPNIAKVFLDMYMLVEPNPDYLGVAFETAKALIKVQDSRTGGFYYDGMLYPDMTPYDPHPANYRRSAILDGNTMQSCLSFLLDMYNLTHEVAFLTAINQGMKAINEMRTSLGGWIQKSNYPDNTYPSYVTLKNGCMKNTFFLYLKAYDILGEERYLRAARRAAEFLIDYQGEEGAPLQQGWAQQYSLEGKPAWGRPFEPPSFSVEDTVDAIWILSEMFLRTQDRGWMTPVEEAVNWLKHSTTIQTIQTNGISTQGYARLYELETNLPIYGIAEGGEGRKVEYIYDIEKAIPGYTWQGDFGVTEAIEWYEFLEENDFNSTLAQDYLNKEKTAHELMTEALNSQTLLKEEGFWVNDEGLIEDKLFWNHARKMMGYLLYQIRNA